MARPTILDAQLQTEIVNLLTLGATIEDCCAAVGITKTSYYEWVKRGNRGRKGDELYTEFSNAVTRARVQARMAAITTVRRAIKADDVNAAQWYLERSDPANWGKRTFVEGNLSVSLVNRAARALMDAGLDPSEIFENLIAEAAYAQQSNDSTEGD